MIRYLRLAVIILSLLFLSIPLLSACTNGQTTTSSSETGTTTAAVPVETTTTADPTTTERETTIELPEMIDLAQIGQFTSGHTLLLAGGQWYDVSGQEIITNISGMTVASDDIGRPTISRPRDNGPLLRIEGSEQIVFRQVRFGFERADFQPGDPFVDMPLIEIIDSASVRFEQCEFFGSSGAAIYLSNSENIVFDDCQFYNLAGMPITTDPDALPSQVYIRDSSFESIRRGSMTLNLRASVWENCTFMGFDSYIVPVPSGTCTLAGGLDQLLAGKLSARVTYHSDADKRLSVRNSLFTSRETYNLFSALEKQIMEILPAGWSGLALTGQKQEEGEPGKPLDPTLGIALELRVVSGGNENSGDSFYNTARMLSDLAPLAALPEIFDDHISGTVDVHLYNQSRLSLLNISIMPDDIIPVLQADPRSDLSRLSQIILLDNRFIPAEFTGRGSGQIIARDAAQSISQALNVDAEPLILWPEDETGRPSQLELNLDFLGTELTAEAAGHFYSLAIHRYTAASQDNCHEAMELARIHIRADNGVKTDLTADENGRRFSYASDTDRDAVAQAMAEPLILQGEELSLLRTEEDIEWARTPLLIYSSADDEITLKLPLYDQDRRPRVVVLTLVSDGVGGWQIGEVDLLE